MSSLIDDAPEGVNTPEFTVSEISGAVKRVVEGEFGHVRVRGEVGRWDRGRGVRAARPDPHGHDIPARLHPPTPYVYRLRVIGD